MKEAGYRRQGPTNGTPPRYAKGIFVALAAVLIVSAIAWMMMRGGARKRDRRTCPNPNCGAAITDRWNGTCVLCGCAYDLDDFGDSGAAHGTAWRWHDLGPRLTFWCRCWFPGGGSPSSSSSGR